MRKLTSTASLPTPMRLWLFLIAGFVLLLDQATKLVVDATVSDAEVIPVIPGVFRILRVENRGMAFGLMSDSPSPLVLAALIAVSAAALALMGYLLWKSRFASRSGSLGLALALGGAAGNIVDRIARGMVLDFLDVYIGAHHWPAFNVADAAIVAGVGLLVLDLLRGRTPHHTP